MIFSGLAGSQNAYANFNMSGFWIGFVLGFAYLTAALGNLYARLILEHMGASAVQRTVAEWRASGRESDGAMAEVVAERKDVLKIPNTALRFSPPEGTKYSRKAPEKIERNERLVYTLEADGQTMVPVVVKVGITDNVYTEVLSGLPAEASVITASIPAPKKGLFSGSSDK